MVETRPGPIARTGAQGLDRSLLVNALEPETSHASLHKLVAPDFSEIKIFTIGFMVGCPIPL